MSNWDKIVKEISYQTKSGSVDFTDHHMGIYFEKN